MATPRYTKLTDHWEEMTLHQEGNYRWLEFGHTCMNIHDGHPYLMGRGYIDLDGAIARHALNQSLPPLLREARARGEPITPELRTKANQEWKLEVLSHIPIGATYVTVRLPELGCFYAPIKILPEGESFVEWKEAERKKLNEPRNIQSNGTLVGPDANKL